jgi:hypothetical protein
MRFEHPAKRLPDHSRGAEGQAATWGDEGGVAVGAAGTETASFKKEDLSPTSGELVRRTNTSGATSDNDHLRRMWQINFGSIRQHISPGRYQQLARNAPLQAHSPAFACADRASKSVLEGPGWRHSTLDPPRVQVTSVCGNMLAISGAPVNHEGAGEFDHDLASLVDAAQCASR